MTALVIIEGVVILLLAILVVGLLRSHADVLRALHELGVNPHERTPLGGAAGNFEIATRPGVPEPRAHADLGAHDIAGSTIDGGSAVVSVAGVDHTTLIAFLSSGCSTCADFWAAFEHGEADQIPGVSTRLVVVTQGPELESVSTLAELAAPGLTTVMSSEAWDDYGVPVSPYFVLVDGPSGRVAGEGAASSWPQVLDLLRKAVADGGMDLRPRRTRREFLTGSQREERADRELATAGIHPGHASLYPETLDDVEGDGDDD
ncbi:MAG: hypothetical protein JJLCMIEE_01280 [Acidimicrobiales bacterium]|nr:MAG: hypothetical protein EDR02_07025 [Actinomycetota bacterium]MBV6508220.1 hypothetical protein [Acidimicrobiales bacterium]RIK07293.1 MAG: hypothetical protein DCC48_04225 [Acidobacteriota bacterium]